MATSGNEAGLALVAHRKQEAREQPQRDREEKERARLTLARTLKDTFAAALPVLDELNHPLLEVVWLKSERRRIAAYPLRQFKENKVRPQFYLTLEGDLLQDYSRTLVDSDDHLFFDASDFEADAICQRIVTLDQLHLQQLQGIQAAYLLGLARKTVEAKAEAEAARRPWNRFLKWLNR